MVRFGGEPDSRLGSRWPSSLRIAAGRGPTEEVNAGGERVRAAGSGYSRATPPLSAVPLQAFVARGWRSVPLWKRGRPPSRGITAGRQASATTRRSLIEEIEQPGVCALDGRGTR